MTNLTTKYELVRDNQTPVLDRPAFRIRALRPIPEHGIRKGDVGGFVESERNLSQHGSAWISDNAMAVGRSRVEHDGYMADRSILSDHAQLTDHAQMVGHSRGSSHTVIRGHARLSGLAHATDDTTVEGSVQIGHGAALVGDAIYCQPDDAPWRFSCTQPDAPSYEPHLLEALSLDDALIGAFAQMGAETPQERLSEAVTLLSTTEGRSALHAIAKASGGTFHPLSYIPLDARTTLAEQASEATSFLRTHQLTGYQTLCSIHPAAVIASDTGHAWYAGVLQAVSAHEETRYIPALCEDINDPKAIAVLPLAVSPLAMQFGSVLDAESAAMARLAQLHALDYHQDRSDPISVAAVSLPIISRIQSGPTNAIINASSGTGYSNLLVDLDAAAQADLEEITRSPDFEWQPTKIVAVSNPHHIALELPPPSVELLKALDRAKRATLKEGSIIMKRDMDLVRSILLDIEANQNINGHFVLSDADFTNLDADRSQVQYHLRLLMDAGYIEGTDILKQAKENRHTDPLQIMKDSGSPIAVERMTWEGHEFLDSVRDNAVWQKTKGYLKGIGGVGVEVVKDVAKAVVKGQLQDLGLNI